MSRARHTTLSPIAMLAATGVLVVGFVAGCTRERVEAPVSTVPVSTVGVLKADDLGPGDWVGPFDPFDHEPLPAKYRMTLCSFAGLWNSSPYPEREAMAAWVDGEIEARSFAQLYGDSPSILGKKMREVQMTEDCVTDRALAPGDGDQIQSFTYQEVDGVIVTHERNNIGKTVWVLDTAVTSTEDSIVGVQISYPEGTTSPPDVIELLNRAVEVSAELTDTPASGESESRDQ
jgi:hypothetical protein